MPPREWLPRWCLRDGKGDGGEPPGAACLASPVLLDFPRGEGWRLEAVVVATVLVQWAGLIYVAWPWIKGPC